MLFKVWYGDGSTFIGHESDDAYRCPGRNVQMVTVADPEHGWRLIPAGDYYWWLHDQHSWYSGDHFGLWDHLTLPGPTRVLFGRTIPTPEFRAILQRAIDDVELGRKTGWLPGEREKAGVP